MVRASRALLGMLVITPCVLLAMRGPDGAAADDGRTSKAPAPIRVALTIDDLPANALPGYDGARIMAQLVAALRAHDVRSATGFVIGERLETPEARAALEIWTRAGYELGNHSYSHVHLGDVGVDAYLADVARLDPLLRALEQETAQRRRYFRYPFLEEGRSASERAQLTRGIATLGYELARVSIDFRDWSWADAYARCLARGDDQTRTLLSRGYVRSASASLAWSVELAEQLLRRPLVHVLLLHANVATAMNLDALLDAYERAGVQFVPLAEALADPTYTAEHEADISHVLTLESLRQGRVGASPPAPPLELLEMACR